MPKKRNHSGWLLMRFAFAICLLHPCHATSQAMQAPRFEVPEPMEAIVPPGGDEPSTEEATIYAEFATSYMAQISTIEGVRSLEATAKRGLAVTTRLRGPHHRIARVWQTHLLSFSLLAGDPRGALQWSEMQLQNFTKPGQNSLPFEKIMAHLMRGVMIHSLCWLNRASEAEPLVPLSEPYFSAAVPREDLNRYTDWALETFYHPSLLGYGSYYKAKGEYAAAESWFRRAMERSPSTKTNYYAKALAALADLYGSMRDYSREEPLLVECYEVYKQLHGEMAYETNRALTMLG